MGNRVLLLALMVGSVACESKAVKEERELRRKKIDLWNEILHPGEERDKAMPACAYPVVEAAVKVLPAKLDKSFVKAPASPDALRGAVPFRMRDPHELPQYRKGMWDPERLVEPNEALAGIDPSLVDYDATSCRSMTPRTRRAHDSVGKNTVKETPLADYEAARDEIKQPMDTKPPAKVLLMWEVYGETGGANYRAKNSFDTMHLSSGIRITAGLTWIDLASGKVLASATGDSEQATGIGSSTTESAAQGASDLATKMARKKAFEAARTAMAHWNDPAPPAPPAPVAAKKKR
jgi:hypothetical protein